MVAAGVVLTVAATPAMAWAADPPDITGFTVDQAETALRNWDKTVVITYVPSLRDLPDGYTRDTVLVASSLWVKTPGVAAVAPLVRVDLGATLPDLTSLTALDASRSVAPMQLKTDGLPRDAQSDWVVVGQRPAAGTVVAFGSLVTLILTAPSPAATTPPVTTPPVIVTPPGRRADPLLVAAVAGGSGLLLVLAALATTSTMRRRRRRRRDPAPEHIEARGHPGHVVGPHIAASAPSVSVRLEPRSSLGTITLEEADK